MKLRSSNGSVKLEFKRKKVKGPDLLPPLVVQEISEEERGRVDPVTTADVQAAMVGGGKHTQQETMVVEPAVGGSSTMGAPPPYEESEASHAVTSDGISPGTPRSPVAP